MVRRGILLSCALLATLGAASSRDTTSLSRAWERPIPAQSIPKGLTSLRAEDCGACHTAIYQEWKQSTHALALRDPQFQAEWKKDNYFACLNCHTPLENQLEFVTTGLRGGDIHQAIQHRNTDFDSTLRNEAITCAACHVRNGTVLGPDETPDAPHAERRDTAFLSATLCMTCHNVVDTVNAALLCTFETGNEWQRNWAAAAGKTCVTCHMPDTLRPDADGVASRRGNIHLFAGSGIPKLYGLHAGELNGFAFTPDSVHARYAAGDTLAYTLTLQNRFAGHNVPTGDPERYFLVTFRLTDSAGAVVNERTYRIGEEWKWYPTAQKLSDNNVPPMATRAYAFSCVVPKKSSLTLHVDVTKHRMSRANATYDHIAKVYPLSIPVFTRTYPIRVAAR